MNFQKHPGEKLQGRSYAHTVTLHYMSGWSVHPTPQQCDFRVIGHYSTSHADGDSGKYPHFVVEYVEVPKLPYMRQDEMPLLLTILRRELMKLTEIEVAAVRRDLLIEVGEP